MSFVVTFAMHYLLSREEMTKTKQSVMYSDKRSKILSKMMLRITSLSSLFLISMLPFSLSGQDTVFMGVDNHQSIVSNYVVLYADNGPGNPHSPRVDASYTIKATDSTYNCKIIIRNGSDHTTYPR